MTPEQYQNEANRTESIVTSIEGYKPTRLIHGMFGLISESGEIADTLKRWLYYYQPLDEDNLKEEIGDLLWYVALLCNTLEIQMSDCMESNIRKLQKRFPEKFDQELAKEENRDRESEMEAVTQNHQISDKKSTVNTSINEDDYKLGKSVGFCAGVKLAEEVADMLDGQDRKQALKMLEQRRVKFLEKGQD